MRTRLFHAVVLAGAALGAASAAACGGAAEDDLWAEPTGTATPALAASDLDAAAASPNVPPIVAELTRDPWTPVNDPDGWPPTKM